VAALHALNRSKPNRTWCGHEQKESVMISWAVTFFVIALIAAVFGFTGIAGAAVHIAWLLAVVGIVFAVIFAILGRRPPG